MKDLELNKIFASILFVAMIMVGIGVIVNALYKPEKVLKKGYHVEVSNNTSSAPVAEKPLDIPALLASANIEKGKVIAKKCIACHTLDKGGHNKVGPNLWGIIGNKKAHLGSAFNYSKAMLSKGGHWGYDELFHFLKKPQKYVSGTKMAFAGLSKPEQIADVVLYLHSLNDNPIPLPKVEKKKEAAQSTDKGDPSQGNKKSKEGDKQQGSTDHTVLLANADVKIGDRIAKKSSSCYSLGDGEPNKFCPNIWDIVGDKRAHLGSGFNYSQAMLNKGGRWGYEELFNFLKKPQEYLTGTKMTFSSLSKPQQRADVILYYVV